MDRLKKYIIILGVVLASSLITLNAYSTPGYLGVNYEEINDEYAAKNNLPVAYGVFITSIVEGAGAEKAGLKANDIILEIDGKKIDQAGIFAPTIANKNAGEKIMLKVLRDGKTLSIEALLSGKPDSSYVRIAKSIGESGPWTIQFMSSQISQQIKESAITFPGMFLYKLKPEIAKYFEVKSGYLVLEVADDSPASKAGFKSGDVVLKVNGNAITSNDDIKIMLKKSEEEKEFKFDITRDGKEMTMNMKMVPSAIGSIDLLVNPMTYRIYADEMVKERIMDMSRKAEQERKRLEEEVDRIRKKLKETVNEDEKQLYMEKLKHLEETDKQMELQIKERLKDIESKGIEIISSKIKNDTSLKMEQKLKEMEMRLMELEKKLKEAEAKNK